jgi:hypothetical protein
VWSCFVLGVLMEEVKVPAPQFDCRLVHQNRPGTVCKSFGSLWEREDKQHSAIGRPKRRCATILPGAPDLPVAMRMQARRKRIS